MPTPDHTPTGDLREQLRAAIDDAGRHQVTIAADLGVTTKHLCAMLTGRANLSLEWAERIAGACGREVIVAVVAPDSDLRERLADALTREHYRRAAERIEASPEEHCAGFADAVMHAIEPHILAITVDATERADLLAGRLEQAERERDEALEALAYGAETLRRAEQVIDWRPAYNRLAHALTEALTRAETAERQREQALDQIADERRGKLAAEAAARRVQALIDSYPPGSRFARSGAQALFRAALDAEQPKETP